MCKSMVSEQSKELKNSVYSKIHAAEGLKRARSRLPFSFSYTEGSIFGGGGGGGGGVSK